MIATRVLSILICLLFSYPSFSLDSEGYILLQGDSVKGIVDVPVKKIIGGKKEIDFGKMWSQIKFTAKAGKEDKKKAGEIAGYGFLFEGTWYHFEVLDLPANSGMKTPKLLGKFVNDFRFFVHRVEDAPVPVYKEYWNEEKVTSERSLGTAPTRETVTGYKQNVEIYAKNKKGIFIEIPEMKTKKLKEYLKTELGLEAEFLNTIDDKTNKDGVEDILKKYNEWKRRKTR